MEKLLEELKKINLPKSKFAIFGSGPLAIRNIRKSGDINIIVKEDLWNQLSKKHKVIENKVIKIGNIEIYKNWKPWLEDTNRLIEDSDIIKGLRFVKLKYVLEWKKKDYRGREKDKKDIQLIEDFLKNNNL